METFLEQGGGGIYKCSDCEVGQDMITQVVIAQGHFTVAL